MAAAARRQSAGGCARVHRRGRPATASRLPVFTCAHQRSSVNDPLAARCVSRRKKKKSGIQCVTVPTSSHALGTGGGPAQISVGDPRRADHHRPPPCPSLPPFPPPFHSSRRAGGAVSDSRLADDHPSRDGGPPVPAPATARAGGPRRTTGVSVERTDNICTFRCAYRSNRFHRPLCWHVVSPLCL